MGWEAAVSDLLLIARLQHRSDPWEIGDDRLCIGIERLMVVVRVWGGNDGLAFMKADRAECPSDAIGSSIRMNKVVPIPDNCRVVGGGVNPQIEARISAEKTVEPLKKHLKRTAGQVGTLIPTGFTLPSWCVQKVEQN